MKITNWLRLKFMLVLRSMKKVLVFIFLSLYFITPSQADDIRDFQIEQVSIGDSLYDHFNDEHIKLKMEYPSSNDYSGTEIPEYLSNKKFDKYDSITLHWKTNDKTKTIIAVSGINLFPNNLKKCLKERDKISKEMKGILTDYKESEYKMNYGKDNNSIGYAIDLAIKDGSIRVWCNDWDKKRETENKWEDDLNISIETKKFIHWLDNEAFK